LSVLFERGSQLQIQGSKAFSYSSLPSLNVPRSVLTIETECFFQGQLLSLISFEPDSQLARIGSNAFANIMIHLIRLPSRSVLVAANAFLPGCHMTE
jgi:hypothetical protein